MCVGQGTVSSVEIDMGHGRFYTTTVVPRDEAAGYGARGSPKAEVGDPGAYNPEFFRLNIPQVSSFHSLLYAHISYHCSCMSELFRGAVSEMTLS